MSLYFFYSTQVDFKALTFCQFLFNKETRRTTWGGVTHGSFVISRWQSTLLQWISFSQGIVVKVADLVKIKRRRLDQGFRGQESIVPFGKLLDSIPFAWSQWPEHRREGSCPRNACHVEDCRFSNRFEIQPFAHTCFAPGLDGLHTLSDVRSTDFAIRRRIPLCPSGLSGRMCSLSHDRWKGWSAWMSLQETGMRLLFKFWVWPWFGFVRSVQ